MLLRSLAAEGRRSRCLTIPSTGLSCHPTSCIIQPLTALSVYASDAMIPAETLALFFVASVALALAPGPDNILVLVLSAMAGCAAGIAVTAGLCTGQLVHTATVALGVATLFQSSATAFTVLKLMGAVYLCYLAWTALTAGPFNAGAPDGAWWSLYLRGVILNITNPKVAIFFIAFLPQFADPGRGLLAAQIFFLGTLFILASIIVFSAIAFTAAYLNRHIIHSESAQRLINLVAAIVFVGLALRLALISR